jgi:transcriptional regulator GlxA family with amidase domain
VRLEAARPALERSDDTVTALARSIGFRSAESMRRTFVEHLGTSPSEYRHRFTHTQKVPR